MKDELDKFSSRIRISSHVGKKERRVGEGSRPIPSYTLKFSYYGTNLQMVNNADKWALALSGCCSYRPTQDKPMWQKKVSTSIPFGGPNMRSHRYLSSLFIICARAARAQFPVNVCLLPLCNHKWPIIAVTAPISQLTATTKWSFLLNLTEWDIGGGRIYPVATHDSYILSGIGCGCLTVVLVTTSNFVANGRATAPLKEIVIPVAQSAGCD